MEIYQDSGIDRLKHFLDFAAKRQQVINSNIANIETPNYRAKELNFEDVFRSELSGAPPLKATREGHFGGKPVLVREEAVRVQEPSTDTLGNDLNNVDLDREMTRLAENVLKFSAVSRIVEMKLSMIRSSIGGA